MILAIERSSKFPPNNTYTMMTLCGTTYTDGAFREWVAKTWNVDANSTFEQLAEAAMQGGWSCFKLLV